MAARISPLPCQVPAPVLPDRNSLTWSRLSHIWQGRRGEWRRGGGPARGRAAEGRRYRQGREAGEGGRGPEGRRAAGRAWRPRKRPGRRGVGECRDAGECRHAGSADRRIGGLAGPRAREPAGRSECRRVPTLHPWTLAAESSYGLSSARVGLSAGLAVGPGGPVGRPGRRPPRPARLDRDRPASRHCRHSHARSPESHP